MFLLADLQQKITSKTFLMFNPRAFLIPYKKKSAPNKVDNINAVFGFDSLKLNVVTLRYFFSFVLPFNTFFLCSEI